MNCLLLLALTTLLVAINLPLGYLRHEHERYAYGWYFYLHLSLPVIVYLRVKTGYEWRFIPVLLCGAVLGQILGGLLAQRHREAEESEAVLASKEVGDPR